MNRAEKDLILTTRAEKLRHDTVGCFIDPDVLYNVGPLETTELPMLKHDKEAFLALVSGDDEKVRAALEELNARELGHFEDHPVSAKLVKENLPSLIKVWNETTDPTCREWVLQFVADARVADPTVKPLVVNALSDPKTRFLPTVLYLMGTQPALFADVGELLVPLAHHPDEGVRWRVAWFISNVRNPDSSMRKAILMLRNDAYDTTQVYVRECLGKFGVQD